HPWLARRYAPSPAQSNTSHRLRRRRGREQHLLWNPGSRAARIIHGPPRYRATQIMVHDAASRRSFAGNRWNGAHNTRNAPVREATNHWPNDPVDHQKLTWTASLLI